jgi:hypothetical protein
MMAADEKIPVGWYVCQAGCRGTAGYGGDYWTAIVMSNRLFYYIQTKNIRNFE